MSINCGLNNVHLRSRKADAEGYYSDIICGVPCKSWDCPECRRKKGLYIQEVISKEFCGEDVHMLTLTYFQNVDKMIVWQNVGKTWNRLLTYIRKKIGNIKFVRIVEPHQSGYPHLHIIISKYISLRVIGQHLTQQGFGWNAQIIKISCKSAAVYCSKYLTKMDWSEEALNLRKISKTRIVSASKGIILKKQSDHEFEVVTPSIPNANVKEYAEAIMMEGINTGSLPITICCNYKYIRINWLCQKDAEYYDFAILTKDIFVSKLSEYI